MVASLLADSEDAQATAELLLREPLPDGTEPEDRWVMCGISWERYLALDKALGDDRPGPRFYFLDRDLEIVSTSDGHERIKTRVGELLAIYFDEAEIEASPRGQATMRRPDDEVGAEPDLSWCLQTEKQFPDLAIEIALTSGGVRKLELYRRFEVPEVWIWCRDKLEIHSLRPDGSGYDRVNRSALLPTLPIELLEICVKIPSGLQSRGKFRAALAEQV